VTVESVKKEYKIELTVVIDDANRQRLIDVGRTCLPGESVITVDDALLELVQNHPAFEEARIEVDSISCTTEEDAAEFVERALNGAAGFEPSSTRETADRTPPEDAGDELDDYDTGVYLCRWPNGDFSVVTADSKRDAIIALDEWAGAHPSQLHPIDRFMADFRLSDDGEIDLTQLSGETHEVVWDTCYPALRDLLASDEAIDIEDSHKSCVRERVRKAVEHERTRLWDNQPVDEPTTEMGRRIAKHMGTSAVVADYYVEEMARQVLEFDDDEDRKPN
jgi:hypothetical protein